MCIQDGFLGCALGRYINTWSPSLSMDLAGYLTNTALFVQSPITGGDPGT